MRSLRIRVLSGSACVALALAGGPLSAGVLPDGLKIEQVLPNASSLGDIAQSPTGELWLLEKSSGVIRVYDSGVETLTLTLAVEGSCAAGLLDVAFPPDYASSGRALVSYRHPSGALRVDDVVRSPNGLALGSTRISIDADAGCRGGGGLVVGADGNLYIGVGDLGDPASAQDNSALGGKVLRVDLDGSIPPDNPDPTSPVFARGFGDVNDLAVNPATSRPGGTVYAADSGGSVDEINVLSAGSNYGWDVVSGNSQGAFDDPLISLGSGAGLEALITLRDDGLGSDNAGSLIYAVHGVDRLEQSFLSGPDKASLSGNAVWFDPAGDEDGTPDTGCPREIDALLTGRDGMVYMSSNTANPGLWRVYRDLPGPREVSPPGSPFPLRVGKQGGQLSLSWEHLGPLDSGRPPRHGGQHAEAYQVWEGRLPLVAAADSLPAYDHTPILATDGTGSGPATRTATIAPSSGDRYYLVTAQGDNLEGSAGAASDGTRREASTTDYCTAIGVGRFIGNCIDDFRSPVTGEKMKLIDYNPLSPTYMLPLSIRDFRGKVVHLDISADNCFLCNLQAPTFHDVDLAYRGRDFVLITILNAALSGPIPFGSAAECAEKIADWSLRHNEHTPVLCDVDLDADGLGDVSRQYFHLANEPVEACGGTPQNFFIDPGGAIYAFQCSYTPGPQVVTVIAPEVNPDVCE